MWVLSALLWGADFLSPCTLVHLATFKNFSLSNFFFNRNHNNHMKASLFCVNVILLWIMQSAQTKLFYKMMQIKHFIQKSSLKEIGQQFTKTTCKKKTQCFTRSSFNCCCHKLDIKWEVTSKESQKTKTLHMQITWMWCIEYCKF